MRQRLIMALIVLWAGWGASAQTSTPLPSPTPSPTSTPDPAATAEATPQADSTEAVTVDTLLNLQLQPPLDIDLPPDWLFGYDTLVFNEFDGTPNTVPIALYRGPVTGGTGQIVLLWGFDSIVNPFGSAADADTLWLDGVRLLRQIVFEVGCNIGRFPPEPYALGGEPVVGVRFAAVDCPVGADTRGWFVVTRDLGINFAFYVYAEPITAMDGAAQAELQAILDSVVLRVEDISLDPEAILATEQAIRLTLTAAAAEATANP